MLSDDQYRRLLVFRTGIRRFLRWSERQAERSGLTASQHQLLLAVRGHGDPLGPTIGDAAAYLQLRHNSAVELVDRASKAGFVVRIPDPVDNRVVRLRLTDMGHRCLGALTELHLEELRHLRPQVRQLWEGLGEEEPPNCSG